MYFLGTWPNYFSRRDFWRWDVDKGVVRQRGGARAMVFPREFSTGLIAGLVDECGEAWPVVLHRCGHFWGQKQMTRIMEELSTFYGKPMTELPTGVAHGAIVECLALHGWGRATFDYTWMDKGVLVARVKESPVPPALAGQDLKGKTVDGLLAGAFAGMFSQAAGAELECYEVSCVGRGDAECIFVVALKTKTKKIPELVRKKANLEEIVASVEG